jgi:hypothetical protein
MTTILNRDGSVYCQSEELQQTSKYGYLSPEGAYFPGHHVGHFRLARRLVYTLFPLAEQAHEDSGEWRQFDAQDYLDGLGWVRVSDTEFTLCQASATAAQTQAICTWAATQPVLGFTFNDEIIRSLEGFLALVKPE